MKQTFLDIREVVGLKIVEIGIKVLPAGTVQNHVVVGLHNGIVNALKEENDTAMNFKSGYK